MSVIYSSKDEIARTIEQDLKSSPLFEKHNFKRPLSRLSTLVRAFANAIYLFIDTKLASIYKAIHPHSSGEEDLHEWLTHYGLEWKEAVRARHTVRIGSVDIPSQDISIPQGLIVHTAGDEDQQIRFQLLTSGILSAAAVPDSEGFYTVEMTAECMDAGQVGNVVSHSISEIESPPAGLDKCYNPSNTPVIAGSERESVTDVRARIQNFENAQNSMWTENWYISEAEKYIFVKRCIFISAKKLNMPGTVKLLLIGAGYASVSAENLQTVQNDFNGEDKNPGGSAHVIADNAPTVSVNRSIQVFFADSDSIISESGLMEVIEEYFRTLNTGDTFKESDLRYRFYSLPKVFQVAILPIGDTVIPEGSVAVPGIITVEGLVYTA